MTTADRGAPRLPLAAAETASPHERVWIALGANLGDPLTQVTRAIAELGAMPQSSLVAASSLYRSAAWGASTPQPDYINAVVVIDTALSPSALLAATRAIEARHGRIRSAERNAARTLDIDILLYGERVVHDDALSIPHPRLHERAFVLLPLTEVTPDAVVPGRGIASTLLAALPLSVLSETQRIGCPKDTSGDDASKPAGLGYTSPTDKPPTPGMILGSTL